MTDEPTPLAIPEAAVDAANHPHWTDRAKLDAAAPLIVAAELDRLARLIDNAPYPYETLERRAAELREGAS